jgi:hypothetical protein
MKVLQNVALLLSLLWTFQQGNGSAFSPQNICDTEYSLSALVQGMA